jgi:hypothetical protein
VLEVLFLNKSWSSTFIQLPLDKNNSSVNAEGKYLDLIKYVFSLIGGLAGLV